MAEPAYKLPEEDRPAIPELRALEGGGESSEPARGHLSVAPEDQSGINNAEKPEPKNSVYSPEGDKNGKFKNTRSRLKNLAGNKLLVGGLAVSGIGTVVIIVLLVLLAGSLKIPNLAQHIAEYQFARVLRQTTESENRITYQKLALQSLDDKAFTPIKDRYSNVRNDTWGKLDNYRPQQVMKNMKADGNLAFKTKTTALGREQITAVSLGGKNYPVVSQSGFTKYIPGVREAGQFRNNLQFTREFAPALTDSLKANNLGPIVRGKVAKQIRKELGISLIAWTVGKYTGKSEEKARIQEFRDSQKKIAQKDIAGAHSKPVDDATKKADEQLRKDLENDNEVKRMLANGGSDPNVEKVIEDTLDQGALKKTIASLNAAYSLGIASCIIYDGSLSESGPTINGQSESQQRSYYYVASAADQQKYGDTTGEAVNATGQHIGDITISNPEIRASGGKVDTTGSLSSQSSSGGSATIVNTLLGNNIFTENIDKGLKASCPAATDPIVGGATAVALALLQAVPGIGEVDAAANATAQTAAKSITARIVENIAKKFGTKDALKETAGAGYSKAKFIGKDTLKSGAKVGGLTILAKLTVMAKSGQLNNGTEQDQEFVNNADSGGNQAGSSLEQRKFYGRPLSRSEAGASHTADGVYVADLNKEKPTFQRYFATSNANSLINKAAITTASTFNHSFFDSVLALTSKILSPLGTFSHVFGSSFTPKSFAAASYNSDTNDYGNVQWGYSEEEMKILRTDYTFTMLDNQKFLDAATQPDGTSTEDAIEAKYGKCFDGSKKIGDMLAEELIIRDDRGNPTNDSDRSDEKNLCAPNNLDPTNNEFGQYMVFRWRVSHNHSNSLDDLINKQELTKETSSASAPDTSAPTSIDVAKVFDDSSKIKCAEGTDDVGVHTGYHNGKSVKIQLCTLPDMPSSSEDSTPGNSLYIAGANGKALVNSRVSASFLALYKAAKQDNIPMSAQSTFRSMAHQTQLCNDNSACANGDNTFVAKPGTSNHQMGIAIDFTMADPTKYPLDHKKCVNVNGRCEAPGDKVWEWLDKNATKFGLKPYNAEFWHWSPNGK